MKFKREKDTKKSSFGKAWIIYEDSFPKNEKRDILHQNKLMHKNEYYFFSVSEKKQVIGLIAVWNLGTFSFIEHLAIKNDLRNKGIGSKLIKKYLDSKNNPVILETEYVNTSAIAKKRIRFWKKSGFILNKYDYIQPPYSKDKSKVPMLIMSYPHAINQKEFNKIRKKIHLKVYGLKQPLIKK
jgi:N-acetylglutamate synthase-like GNAT family acetyltransferase